VPDPAGTARRLRRRRSRAHSLWKHVSTHPFWSALLAAIVIAGLGAGYREVSSGGSAATLPAAGWGPPRPGYWCKRPRSCDGADHVVFNSYVNAPNYGDERAFVDAKPAANKKPGGFRNSLSVTPGEDVLVRFYVNNAAWTARLGSRAGIATGTEARAEMPLTADTRHDVFGYIRARNAQPRVVWDGVTLQSKEPTLLRYEFDSARWWTAQLPARVLVSDALMEEGTEIGSWALDGRFGNSFADGGILTFRVRVEAAAE
jgi:hypothetical protein